MDVTRYMVPAMGDGTTSVLPIFIGEYNSSVWLKNSPLPRVYFEGGPRMGLAYGRVAVNVSDLSGNLIAIGEIRDFSTPNEYASDTFGYVADPALGLRGKPNDLTVGIDKTILQLLETVGSSAVYTQIVFDPKTAIDLYRGSVYETVGTSIRNRRPHILRNSDGKYLGVRWDEVEP